MIEPHCLIGVCDRRDSFQADFAALRKWLPRNPQVKGPSTATGRPAGRAVAGIDRHPTARNATRTSDLPRVAERPPLKRHAVVRCPRRRAADGASMETPRPQAHRPRARLPCSTIRYPKPPGPSLRRPKLGVPR